MAGSSRVVSVPGERWERWVAGFAERHGELSWQRLDDAVQVTASDGTSALVLIPTWLNVRPPGQSVGSVRPTDGPSRRTDAVADGVQQIVAALVAPRRVAVVLARRAGYLLAVVDGGAVQASKVSSRHVQGRTAAGGWSQQRYARRRENQTAALLDAVIVSVQKLILPALPVNLLATGGDAALIAQLLADPRLARLAAVPAGPGLAVGGITRTLVGELPRMLSSVTIRLSEPGR